MTRREPTQPGFTLVEMLVTVAITALLLFLVNRIFLDTTNVMTRGIQAGDIIANQRGVRDQIDLDFVGGSGFDPVNPGGMLGPRGGTTTNSIAASEAEPPGYLLIVHEYINDFDDDGVLDIVDDEGIDMPVPAQRSLTRRELVRTDQICFIAAEADPDSANVARVAAITPRDEDTFSPPYDVSRFRRMWFGHALRVKPNGTDYATPVLGDPDSGDFFGHQLILGRQALHFYDLDATAPAGARRPVHWWETPSTNNRIIGLYNNVPGSDDQAFRGWCDAMNRVVYSDDPLESRPVLFAPDGSPGEWRMHSRLPSTGSLMDTYYARARATAFLFQGGRLRVNPAPSRVDLSDNPLLESSQIAQMHPIFLSNVSDFIVEFAADANNDGLIDRDANYDGLPDVIESPGGSGQQATAPIHWYGQDTRGLQGLPNGFDFSAYDPDYRPLAQAGNETRRVWVWRHDNDKAWDDDDNPATAPNPTLGSPVSGLGNGDADNCSWPYLIRLRYRMHDLNGRLFSNDYSRLVDNLDNDGDGDIDEPDEERIAGQWFEVIVPVPRPQ